ncbi:hypothetical protein BC830DRAFT_1159271 [Chytriomyces sp. MP71]|nr:hypothetical protein BC830DRAFT_1159271 [Chytriomyces sp. MP71]
MGQILGSTIRWFDTINDSMGMVTFGTVIMMFSNDIWQLDFTPRTWVRWMIYFDALAFLIEYIGTCANDLIPSCWQQNSYWLASDLIWSFKDAAKYGYITYKATTLSGYKTRVPCYSVAIISLILYWVLCIQSYGFTPPKCSSAFKSPIPRIVLYLYWTCVDVCASLMVVRKMAEGTRGAEGAFAAVIRVVQMREEARLLVASVGMSAVSALSIAGALDETLVTLNIWRMVFVYVQLLLVLGSQKVVVGNDGSSSAVKGKGLSVALNKSSAAGSVAGVRKKVTVSKSISEKE